MLIRIRRLVTNPYFAQSSINSESFSSENRSAHRDLSLLSLPPLKLVGDDHLAFINGEISILSRSDYLIEVQRRQRHSYPTAENPNTSASDISFKWPIFPVIVFYGESGVGKTVLSERLAHAYPDMYFIPRITTTRPQRADDAPGRYRYVSFKQFTELIGAAGFSYYSLDGARGYGIDLNDMPKKGRIILITCGSPFNVTDPLRACWGNLLIMGDAQHGLKIRHPDDPCKRVELLRKNETLSERFYFRREFLTSMQLAFENDFNGGLENGVAVLHRMIQSALRGELLH